jgi:hypothetical protein
MCAPPSVRRTTPLFDTGAEAYAGRRHCVNAAAAGRPGRRDRHPPTIETHLATDRRKLAGSARSTPTG